MRTRSQAVVNIDFDAASAAWRQNKVAMPNGTFEYVVKKDSNKKDIKKTPKSNMSTKTTRP